jgi:hypothetical protein
MLLPEDVDLLFRLHVDVLKKLPQLGHFSLALAVDVQLLPVIKKTLFHRPP